MPRNLYCNVLGSSPNVQNLVSKIFAKYCKRLVSKVSCLVSVSKRSSLGLATSVFRLDLEDFGRDSSSGLHIYLAEIYCKNLEKAKGLLQFKSGSGNNMTEQIIEFELRRPEPLVVHVLPQFFFL